MQTLDLLNLPMTAYANYTTKFNKILIPLHQM